MAERQFVVVASRRSIAIREVATETSLTLSREQAWELALKKANGIRFITFTGLNGDMFVAWEPK